MVVVENKSASRGCDRTALLAPYWCELDGHRLLFYRGISAKLSLEDIL
jgi:hypothetical protein